MRRFAATFSMLALLAAALMGQPREMTVYYNDRPPLYEVATQSGFLVEITKMILRQADIPFRLVELPSNRIQETIRAGNEYAMGIGWFKNPERESWARFSKAIYRDKPQVVLVNAERSPALGSTIELSKLLSSGLVLGKKDGYSFGLAIDQAVASAKVPTVSLTVEIPQLVRMIALGRIDYTILGLEEANYILKNEAGLGKVRIVTLADPPEGNLRYLMISKAVEESTIARIDEAIDKVLATKAYRDLTTF